MARGRSAYQSFVSKRMRQLIGEGYAAKDAMRQAAKEWRARTKNNPMGFAAGAHDWAMPNPHREKNPDFQRGDAVDIGDMGIGEYVKPAGSRGGIGGMFGKKYAQVEVQGKRMSVPLGSIRALANPIYGCPACHNPIRSRAKHIVCSHCGAHLQKY